MKRDIQSAIDEVEVTYEQLVEVANMMTEPILKEVNNIIASVQVNDLFLNSNDSIRNLMLTLSLKSFSIAEIKDKASLKQECSETLKKQKFAEKFNCGDGSVAVRENSAMISTAEETLTQLVYELVSSTFKTKVDEIHRIVDVLKTILMSKSQEAKMTQNVSVGEVGERTYLKE